MKQLFWKTYTIILASIVTIVVIAATITPQNILWIEYIPRITFLILAIFGLYGFTWKKRMLFPFLWKLVFIIMTALSLWVIARNSVPQFCSTNTCFIINAVVGLMLIAPLFYGLFLYAFRSQDIWIKKFQ